MSQNQKAPPASDSTADLLRAAGDSSSTQAKTDKPAVDQDAADNADTAAPPAATAAPTFPSGIECIALERQRQITIEGYVAEHDDAHTNGALTVAAMCYARAAVEQQRHNTTPAIAHPDWPWHQGEWKPDGDPVRNLEKSGALIAAEIDRLLRARADA